MTKSFNVKPAPQPVLLDRFRKALLQHGKEAVRTDETRLARSDNGRDELFYVPFEHMNCRARLVIVGITPGPNQMELAYAAVQARLRAGLSDDMVLERAKKEGSFGGDTMRPNLVKMLEYFGIPELLGVGNANDLWGISCDDLHATSVIPHAAFRNGKPFAGSFQDVLETKPFRECFERDFAATLPLISQEARYIALGPTPLEALDWCSKHGLLKPEQVLGAFAHPSRRGGSQVAVYIGEKLIEALSPKDPVKKRKWLVPLAERMSRSVAAWRASPACVA
jgi:hypothetical protein